MDKTKLHTTVSRNCTLSFHCMKILVNIIQWHKGNFCTIFQDLFIISLIITTYHLCHAGSVNNEQSLMLCTAVSYERQLDACQSGWSVSCWNVGPKSTVITSVREYIIWLKTKQCEDNGYRRNNRKQSHMPKHETAMLDVPTKLHVF